MKKLLFLLLTFFPVLVFSADKSKAGGANDVDTQIAKIEIAELINSWTFFRDQERWSDLANTFADDGTISISWFDGPHKAFVAASQKLAAYKNNLVKHQLGVPFIKVNGNRALSEVNVNIMARTKTPAGEVDIVSSARFIDQVEKRDGQWKLVRRTAVYEKDRADPVDRPVLPDAYFQGLEQFPVEVRFLAAALKKAGADLSKNIVLDKSPAAEKVYSDGAAWLKGA